MNAILVGRKFEIERVAMDQKDVIERYMGDIQQFAQMDGVKPEDVIVRGMNVCNGARDFYYSRFTKEALGEVAELLPGRPLMQNHDYRSNAIGRFFHAQVVTRDGRGSKQDRQTVQALFYMPNDEQGQREARRMDLGVWSEGSLGWRCVGADCNMCGNQIGSRDCGHVPGDIYGRGMCEYHFSGVTGVLEASTVFAGGQKGTSIFNPAAQRSLRDIEVNGNVLWRDVSEWKRALIAEDVERIARAEQGLRGNVWAIRVAKSVGTMQDAKRWVREHDFRVDRAQDEDGLYLFKQTKDRPRHSAAIDLDEGVAALVPDDGKREAPEAGESVESILAL